MRKLIHRVSNSDPWRDFWHRLRMGFIGSATIIIMFNFVGLQ